MGIRNPGFGPNFTPSEGILAIGIHHPLNKKKSWEFF
jgi:hypothetical protein